MKRQIYLCIYLATLVFKEIEIARIFCYEISTEITLTPHLAFSCNAIIKSFLSII